MSCQNMGSQNESSTKCWSSKYEKEVQQNAMPSLKVQHNISATKYTAGKHHVQQIMLIVQLNQLRNSFEP
jgi:hypothetical protein